MNEIFQPYLRRYVLVFFDNILVYSKTWADHLEYLTSLLSLLCHNQFYAKLPKCVFGLQQIDYLGHVIFAQDVMNREEVQDVLDWPLPTTITQLRGFLGLTGCYRRFVCNFAIIASPLTDLLKKNAFTWTTKATTSFCHLQQAPILQLPKFAKILSVETDATGTGIGVVLA